MRTSTLAAALALALAVPGLARATPPSPAGRWLTADRGGVIEIAPCQGDAMCGRIVGMDYEPGHEPTDVWHRPQCGLTLLYDLKPGDGSWDGRVLNPRSGQMYGASVTIPDPETLKLRGYLGISLFGQTVTWTRYHGPPIGPACKMAK